MYNLMITITNENKRIDLLSATIEEDILTILARCKGFISNDTWRLVKFSVNMKDFTVPESNIE